MLTILLAIYAAIITLLFICGLIGASEREQDAALSETNYRLIVKDFIGQINEAKSRISGLEVENSNLQAVIERQDSDLETCHKLLESSLCSAACFKAEFDTPIEPPSNQLSTDNSQLSTPPEVPDAQTGI